MNIESLIDRLLPDPNAVRKSVESLRKDHPNESPAELAQRLIRSAKMRAGATGAATGAASSPLTMIPAALADMAAVMRIEGMLVGEIAALLHPECLTDATALRADVIAIVFPAAASQALRQFGIRAGERLSQAAIKRYATEDFLRSITRLAARYAGKTLTRESIARKVVPVFGMGIGAGWNWLEVHAIGGRAIEYYSGEPIGPAIAMPKLPAIKNVWPKVRRFLPGKH